MDKIVIFGNYLCENYQPLKDGLWEKDNVKFTTEEILETFFSDNNSQELIDLLFELFHKEFKVTLPVLKSKSRKQFIVFYRHVFRYILVTSLYYKVTYVQAAEALGNKEHTVVVHSKKLMKEVLNKQRSPEDFQLKQIYDKIMSALDSLKN